MNPSDLPTFYIWCNEPKAKLAKSLMAAVRLRMTESWEWTSSPVNAHVWVVDGASENYLSKQIKSLFTKCHKPPTAFFEEKNDTENFVDMHPEWRLMFKPMSFEKVNAWLEESLPNLTKLRSMDADAELQQAAEIKEPWRKESFFLRQWPNMARYGANLQLTMLCGQLLLTPMDYTKAAEVVGEEKELDRLLRDAHNDGLLVIERKTKESPLRASGVTSVFLEPPISGSSAFKGSKSSTNPNVAGARARGKLNAPVNKHAKTQGLMRRILKRFVRGSS